MSDIEPEDPWAETVDNGTEAVDPVAETDAQAEPLSGSATKATLSGSKEWVQVTGYDTGEQVLNDVNAWLGNYIATMHPGDLDVLTLWAAHTWIVEETYTSPRLVLDSPVPGSGKTTTLEHLQRLTRRPVQMAALSSPALLTRMLDAELRTVLIDEADRSLDPKRDGVGELLAILNSGYKRGSTRPVLVPVKGGGWEPKEMPTYAAVVMAGNSPNLPEDTKSRSIRVLLMPSDDAAESDWEQIEDDAFALGDQLAMWADDIREDVRTSRPPLPPQIKGRARERWGPLKRVAIAAGGRWPAVVDDLAIKDHERIEIEREDGLVQQRPAIALLKHIAEAWSSTEQFVPTEQLIDRLVLAHPEMWGEFSGFGKRLTAQRLGRMMVAAYNINTARPDTQGPRGYLRSALQPACIRLGTTLPSEPDKVALLAEPDNGHADPPQGVAWESASLTLDPATNSTPIPGSTPTPDQAPPSAGTPIPGVGPTPMQAPPPPATPVQWTGHPRTDRCTDCGDPTSGPALMRRCTDQHPERWSA